MIRKMKHLNYSRGFYFFFYAAGASLVPFLTIHYQNLGLNGKQIGILVSISPLIMLFSSPVWGVIADLTQKYKASVSVAILGAITSVAVLSQIKSYYLLIPTVVIYAFFSSPIIPIIDHSVMEFLGSNRELYGRIRMWGAVGWGVAGPIIGILSDKIGIYWPFYGYLISMGIVSIFVWKIPITQALDKQYFWSGFRELLRNKNWQAFLVIVYFSGVNTAIITNYLFLYLNEMGVSRTYMGWALTIATISEIPVLFYANHLLRRWGSQGVLLISLFASSIRSLGYGITHDAAVALCLQLFHGLTFSAMWAAGVSYANKNSPPGLGATAQSLFFGVVFGISSITGALFGGLLFNKIGGHGLFLWSGVIMFSVTVGFSIFRFLKTKR